MKKFDIPLYYRSPVISTIKSFRRHQDQRKKDFTPTVLDFGPVSFLIARHFGFCYGVENAIEISYRAIAENPGRRIFLLSEMIHNPEVNADLQSRGVRFIMQTDGRPIIQWEELTAEDVVLVPAFGTTVEIEQRLEAIGIRSYAYDTTCPFVEKVWNKAASIGKDRYTVIVHGKPTHEETRATFSHSRQNAPTVVVKDMNEARLLADVILDRVDRARFYDWFKNQFSDGFDVHRDLERIGVVNQTTMLASDTQAIADFLKQTMVQRFGLSDFHVSNRFAETGDTLCYATNDNQNATYGLLAVPADLIIVAGGYNSSNTSHIVELCREKLPTYLISSAAKIISGDTILHFDIEKKREIEQSPYLPSTSPVRIMLTSGASCPDSIVEAILRKLLDFFENIRDVEEVLGAFQIHPD